MTLFSIYFQSGEFFNQGDGNFFWKMLPSIVGSLIGFGGSLYLYYKKTKDDKIAEETKRTAAKDKEEQEKKARQNDLLTHLSFLIESITKSTEKQVGFFREFKDKSKKEPYEYHMMVFQVAPDINRLEEKIDHHEIFLAYINKFGNSTDSIKQFSKIYSSLDFIYALIPELKKALEKSIKDIYQLKLSFKETSEGISKYMANLQNQIKQSTVNPESIQYYNFLNNTLIDYYTNAPKPLPIPYVHEHLIDPAKQEIIKNFRAENSAMIIADECKKATLLYTEIKLAVDYIVEYFEKNAEKLEKANNELKSEASVLLQAIREKTIVRNNTESTSVVNSSETNSK